MKALSSLALLVTLAAYAPAAEGPEAGPGWISLFDGKTWVDCTEPEGKTGDRRLTHGTFALQGHDPGSKVCFKDIRVKVLPD